MSKNCGKCKQDKDESEFSKKKSKIDGLQPWCKVCKKEYDRIWYSKRENKDKQNTSNRRNRKKYRQQLNDLKAEQGCKNCPESDPCCLDFHHHNDDKVSEVSTILAGTSFSKALEEANKCVVLCANCHRKLHAGRFELSEEQTCPQGVSGNIPVS